MLDFYVYIADFIFYFLVYYLCCLILWMLADWGVFFFFLVDYLYCLIFWMLAD
jgi:hypothetical protein